MDQDSRNISVAAYITPVGWIVAFVAHAVCNCHTPFAVFHLRQGLGLGLIITIFYISVGLANIFLLTQLFYVVASAGIIFGLVQATNQRQKPLPLLGKWFDKKLTFIR